MDIVKLGEIGAIALVFMLLDVLTGYIGACMSHTVSSSKMRQGLGHKFALIVFMTLGGILDYMQVEDIVNFGVQVPLFFITCLYIIIMELNSILENLVIIFPELKGSKIMGVFSNSQDALDRAAKAVSTISETNEKGDENDTARD
ncbi:MAG: hypothetical protein [Caudoviricetes sp.]|nr:MAG: hypothetical protein [Caudoviricetes sp.]